ncbi:portal protein [Microbacterium phage Musetta]|nr:portal protein [Microbacterium phage Musetta]
MSERTANRIRARRDELQERLGEVYGEAATIEVLQEHMSAVVSDLLKFEDEGWLNLFGGLDETRKGFSLSDVKKTTKYLEKQTKILGDLLGRGLRLKNNHAFGRGFSFEPAEGKGKIMPRFIDIMEDPHNKEIVFSPQAMKEINRIFFTSGNFALMYEKKAKQFTRLAVDVNVENVVTFDNDPTRIKYYLRTWVTRNDLSSPNPQPKTHREFVPTSTYAATKPKYPATLDVGGERVKVNTDAVIIDKRINRDNGELWGVPDAFAAAAPAHVYATAMKDGAMLQHALAAIAFIVKAKTQTAAKRAGAQLRQNKVGQAAITGPETEIQSLPRAGSINLYESRPLVARVAAALDVSTTGLTADPGPGGSYASENALSAPEQMAALSRQEDFVALYAEIFRVMGADAVLNFNRLDVDPIHRQAQTLGIFRNMGALNQEEVRGRALELTDIKPIGDGLPKPDEFTGSKYSTLKGQIDAGLANAADAQEPQDAQIGTPGGRTGVGSLDDANSARDE